MSIGFLNRLQLWHDIIFIIIKSDTEIDLIMARIFAEFLHQRKNWVTCIGINMLKHEYILI